MKLLPECYACALRQTLYAARLAGGDERFCHECLLEASLILTRVTCDMTPPEVGEYIYRMVRERSGTEDPYRSQKHSQNRAVEAIFPWLESVVREAGDPLEMAVRLSIAGNAVDPGAQESFDLEASVSAAVSKEGALEGYGELRSELKNASSVLLVLDNCGEVVFDRLLAARILESFPVDLVFAVRGGPIINDVTMAEALEVGLEALGRVISSGMEMPGTVVDRATPEFRRAFDEADVVISKGQGNWETLEGSDRKVFFLFQAKCPAVAAMNGCPEGSLLLLS